MSKSRWRLQGGLHCIEDVGRTKRFGEERDGSGAQEPIALVIVGDRGEDDHGHWTFADHASEELVRDDLPALVRSLMDGLSRDHIEIDTMKLSGPLFFRRGQPIGQPAAGRARDYGRGNVHRLR